MSRRLAASLALALLLSACGGGADGRRAAADSVTLEAEFPAQNRPDVSGLEGAVSSDHTLATAAGYEVLRDGGNAVDAAATMAAVLAVVRPHMNGVGDFFGLFYDGASGEVTALNGVDGEAPAVGTLLRNPALAGTLRTIAERGAGVLYGGEIGDRLAAFLEARGGYLRPGDFADHSSTWTEPIGVDYMRHRVLTFPPNTQGFVLLQQMEMAERFDLASMGHNSARYLHILIELKKLAFGDRARWLADPARSELPMDSLLSEGYLHRRARLVSADSVMTDPPSGIRPAGESGADRTGTSGAGTPPEDPGDAGDTIYLTAVDSDGNAVSWIQSLYHSFGSGLVEPETGIMLQNRGALFTLEEGHPNRMAPGKRPFHTLMPAMALRDGELAFTCGTPGGDSQSQTLLQIFHNMYLFGMTPQQAVEAPRYRSYGGRRPPRGLFPGVLRIEPRPTMERTERGRPCPTTG